MREEVPVPLPRWLAQLNKRVFNPREIRRGTRPVLVHVGRLLRMDLRHDEGDVTVDG